MRWASVNGVYVSISKSETKSFFVEAGWVRVSRNSGREAEVRCYQVTK